MKVTPAALPTRTTSSRVAWKEVAAGAIRVSWVTSCPSEVTEIQEVSLARTTRVSLVAEVSAGLSAVAAKERVVTSLFFSALTASGSALGSGWGVRAGLRFAESRVGADGCEDCLEGCGAGAGLVAGGADEVGVGVT